MAAAPILIRGLRRCFGERVAVDEVDLDVAPGEIVGLVGPNGSGKTTLLRTIAGFLRPHAGTVAVFGAAPFDNQAEIMRRARFAFAPPALFERLTATEHLRYLSGIGCGHPAAPSEIAQTLDWVGLADRAAEPVAAFSFGMRQRLILAQALLPLPELIVLDEPTDGLDPVAVLELRAILKRLRDEHGLAILLSSHLLIEIEELVDRMTVLLEGRTAYAGTPADMVSDRRRLRVRASDVSRACEVLKGSGLTPELAGDWIELPVGSIPLADAARLFEANRLELEAFFEHAPTLEEALLRIIDPEGKTA